MEDTLYRIDRLKDDDLLPVEMYEESMAYMGTMVRFSIKESFAECEFYRELQPQLQKKLFNVVLGEVSERFEFFFHDY